jgi:hypothetical protein
VLSTWATLAQRAQPQQQRLVVHLPQFPAFVADGALACTSQFYLPNYRMGKTLGIGSFGKARVGAWGKARCWLLQAVLHAARDSCDLLCST